MPGTDSVGWGILGCGRVVERRIAPVFAGIPDASLAGFCSRDRSRAERYCEHHGAGAAYDSIEEFLRDKSIEAVYIASPNALHFEQAARCLAAGKHVLVDKPMATSLAHAKRLADEARRTGLRLGVMHQQRYHPANMHLIRLRDEGSLGRINFVRVQMAIWYGVEDNWRWDSALAGGGVLMDLGPHALDLMMEVAGRVTSVNAEVRNLQFERETEDFCSARLTFESGAAGLVDLSYCSHAYGGRVEVFGNKGTFLVDGSMQSAGVYSTCVRHGEEPSQWEQNVYSNNCYRDAIEDFTDAVRHSGSPSVSMKDGIRALRVIEAIYESARQGKTIAISSE